jgi:hypothetical protein
LGRASLHYASCEASRSKPESGNLRLHPFRFAPRRISRIDPRCCFPIQLLDTEESTDPYNPCPRRSDINLMDATARCCLISGGRYIMYDSTQC